MLSLSDDVHAGKDFFLLFLLTYSYAGGTFFFNPGFGQIHLKNNGSLGVVFMPPPDEGRNGHIAFCHDFTSVRTCVCASVIFLTRHNLGTFCARKLTFGMQLTQA